MNIIKCEKEMPTIKGNIGYYVIVYKGHKRWLKIGTSERGTNRFNDRDYRKYTKIVPLFVVEFDKANSIYDFEDIGRTVLRNTKGLVWQKNDRFRFFQMPRELPFAKSVAEIEMVSVA